VAHRFSHAIQPDPAYNVGLPAIRRATRAARVMDISGGRAVAMGSPAVMFAGLIIGVAAIATMAGCTPTTSAGQPYACPAGVAWVPDGYANGKFVPAHCLGQAAQ